MATRTFDLVVIGSGPGGYRAAVLAAGRGLKTVLVERGDWGGACLNRGCVPKKVWFETARLVDGTPGYAARGVMGGLRADAMGAWAHQRRVVEQVRGSSLDYLARLGVARIEGEARFVSTHELAAGAERLSAAHCILATGSQPFVPPDWAAAGDRLLTTDRLFAEPLPPGRRVAVLGSGAVATEMAFILSCFGYEIVWLAGQMPLAASRYSRPAREQLAAALAARGLVPRTAARPRRAACAGDEVVLELPDGSEVRVDWVLAATGRRPSTAALGLAAAGIATTADGFVQVDDWQRTSNPRVLAIGDCASRRMSANEAMAGATIAIEAIGSEAGTPAHREWVPEVIHSALELARTGATEEALESAEREYSVGFSAYAANPAALAGGEAGGYVRLLVDDEDGTLAGCEMAGPGVSELIHLAQPGIAGERLLARLARERFAHPSLAEEMWNAAESLIGRWGAASAG